jgi:dyslexia susceptibility 1 candidate gene 1 protein
MPITGKYTWSEKKDTIKVIIPLKGVSISSVDIFVTLSTLKVNYSPYIIDIITKNEIDPIKHKATVKDGNLNVTLYKVIPGLWGEVIREETDKVTAKEIRSQSVLAQEALEEELIDKRKDRKVDDERYSLRKQMSLDEGSRNKLDNLKLEEKTTAEEEMYATFAQMKANQEKEDALKLEKENKKKGVVSKTQLSSSSSSSIKSKSVDKIIDNKTKDETNNDPKNIFDIDAIIAEDYIDEEEFNINDDEVDDNSKSKIAQVDAEEWDDCNVDDEDDDERYIPPPRTQGISQDSEAKVDIYYTPRFFPTPLRESKVSEEDDWIAKNRRNLKHHANFKHMKKGPNADVSEEDPHWLKGKGDDFFRSSDFKSALNAYSAAIDADENMTVCYNNRSACYLKLKMFVECRLDCIKAIELLQCEIEINPDDNCINESQLVKMLIRRGAASSQLGNFQEALTDHMVALENLVANDKIVVKGVNAESLAVDIDRLKSLVKVDTLKKEADYILSEGKISEAAAKYTESLELISVHVGCLSNRAACKISLGDFQGCVDDCAVALDVLAIDLSEGNVSSQYSGKSSSLNMLSFILPEIGSEKRKTWVIKTILRRAAAYVRLNDLDEALNDYNTAASLDPENQTLKSDINKLNSFRENKRKNENKSSE